MQKKNKYIFIIWSLLILVIYIYNLNYHFEGNNTKIKNKKNLVSKIDSIYNLIDKQSLNRTNQSSVSIFNHFDLNNLSNIRNNKKWRIVLFAHEFCPCTRASITEFHKLSQKYKLNPLIIFSDIDENKSKSIIKEINFENEFNSNKYYTDKLKIKSTIDDNNKLTKSEKIDISGFVVLIDNFNKIIYTGGVTPYRGHEGKSELHFYLEKIKNKNLINTQSINKSQNIEVLNSKVFGCNL